jgi:hypothetical protein
MFVSRTWPFLDAPFELRVRYVRLTANDKLRVTWMKELVVNCEEYQVMSGGLQKSSDFVAFRQRIEPERTVLSCIFRYRTVTFTIIFDIFTVNSGHLSCRRMSCGTDVILPWLEFGQHFFWKCKYISSSVHLVSFQVAHLASAHTLLTPGLIHVSSANMWTVGYFIVLYPLVLLHL